MQDQSNTQDLTQQDCRLLKLSTELRLEICRFAIQHELNAIKSTPYSYNSTTPPFRGALALLHTCRTLRLESIDALEPLALASRSALRDEWGGIPLMAVSQGRRRRRMKKEEPERPYEHLTTSGSHAKKACKVLALARGVDKKKSVS